MKHFIAGAALTTAALVIWWIMRRMGMDAASAALVALMQVGGVALVVWVLSRPGGTMSPARRLYDEAGDSAGREEDSSEAWPGVWP